MSLADMYVWLAAGRRLHRQAPLPLPPAAATPASGAEPLLNSCASYFQGFFTPAVCLLLLRLNMASATVPANCGTLLSFCS